MAKRRKSRRQTHAFQKITLCISTSLVLVLLGLVVLSALTARNTSAYVRENLVVTMLLEQDMTASEATQLCARLRTRPYIRSIHYISKEQALREQTRALGSDPTEFTGGVNPFLPSVELTLAAEYANNDSLRWVSAELRKRPKVSDITYQRDLVESVNSGLTRVSLVLLAVALLLTVISFSLINNTVRLGIYARRFSIHTMKLVGASWGFIRRPFVWQSVGIGLVAALLALGVLAGCVYALYEQEPDVLTVMTWQTMAVTAAAVMLAGVLITAVCAAISVNRFLRMTAGELYRN